MAVLCFCGWALRITASLAFFNYAWFTATKQRSEAGKGQRWVHHVGLAAGVIQHTQRHQQFTSLRFFTEAGRISHLQKAVISEDMYGRRKKHALNYSDEVCVWVWCVMYYGYYVFFFFLLSSSVSFDTLVLTNVWCIRLIGLKLPSHTISPVTHHRCLYDNVWRLSLIRTPNQSRVICLTLRSFASSHW